MKYKHFRALVIVGGLTLGALGLRACWRWAGTDAPPSKVAAPTLSAGTTSAPVGTSASAPLARTPAGPTDPTALGPIDQRILARVKAGVAADKLKDVFSGEPIKVNLYKEGSAVRAKVDLDRDERWDEKWDFESDGGKEVVKRRVSTTDDDTTYDVEYRLVDGRWAKK